MTDIGHKTKVMMLDDEKFLLELYQISFERHGNYEVTAFEDVNSALTALRDGLDPDIILFDIMMPDDTSGYEFIETVHSENLAPHSLKVALTNEGKDGAKERMMELGADGHIFKVEYTPSEVVKKVEEMLKARR